jgi:hypothetical protein
MWRVRLLGGFCVRVGGEEKAADTGAGGDHGSAKMWNRRGISASSRCDPIDPMISPRTAENPQAVATNEVIDLCKIGVHDPAKFFRPVYAEGGGGKLTLEKDRFYILATKERVSIPLAICGEMVRSGWDLPRKRLVWSRNLEVVHLRERWCEPSAGPAPGELRYAVRRRSTAPLCRCPSRTTWASSARTTPASSTPALGTAWAAS